ncbi:MAG: hypothetical protein R6X34_12590 [Chloroflexota bacterium]
MQQLPYVWDYDINREQFTALLKGELTLGRLDQTWAAVRLLEYAPYYEIRQLIDFSLLVEKWPEWRSHIRSKQRRDAYDFLVTWLPKYHPELLQ